MMPTKKKTILLFVEGDTDKEFYDAVLKFYRRASKKAQQVNLSIINLKGIGKFENKVFTKIKNQLLEKFKGTEIVVFCCYDKDLFELAGKPPTDWGNVRTK